MSLSFADDDGLEPSFFGLCVAALLKVISLPMQHQRKL
jgi:hypothetical protein